MDERYPIYYFFNFWRNEYVWMSFITIGFHYICDSCGRIDFLNDRICC